MSDKTLPPQTLSRAELDAMLDLENRDRRQALLDHIAALEAKLAESVPREVAKDCAFLGLCCGSISTTNPYWAPEVVRVAACAENPQNDPGWADAILKDALARAEAKARE